MLRSWRGLLADLGVLGGGLCAAIENDNAPLAIASMMELRRVRSALARVEANGRLQGSHDEAEAIADVAELIERARLTDDAMRMWLSRPMPGDARLLETPLGTAALADAMLPAVWDFETDLVVLVGERFDRVAQVLADLGQRRTITYRGGADSLQSLDELVATIRSLVPAPPAQMVVRASLGYDADELEQIMQRARETLSDLRIHGNTVRAFSRTWLEQGLANVPAIAKWPSIASIGERFAGKPMVIVAPGPSLASNIAQLEELRGRAILTAFSHSLKPVLAAGLVPDLIITVDPQDVRYHFAGCDLSRSCLVNAVTVHPALFELPAPRMLTLSANGAIDNWLFAGVGEEAVVPGGGSVATTALSLALRWGCDPIIFVGLDLSFPGGQYYVSSSSDGETRAHVGDDGALRVDGWSSGFRAMKAGGGPAVARERAIELPGWHGGTVPSSFMFGLFHRWFVERMRSVETVVYNCTEGGAHIEGMVHRPLAEVLATLDGHVDVARELTELELPTRRLAVAAYLSRQMRHLVRANALAKQALACIERSHLDALETIESRLAHELEPLAFTALLAQHALERAHDRSRRDGSAQDYVSASRDLLATLRSVIDQLVPELSKARAQLCAQEDSHG